MVFWDCTLSDCYTHTRVCVCVCMTIHNSQSRKKVEAEFYGSAEALFLFCIKKTDIIAFGVQMAILSGCCHSIRGCICPLESIQCRINGVTSRSEVESAE